VESCRAIFLFQLMPPGSAGVGCMPGRVPRPVQINPKGEREDVSFLL
jgi:hypothetical protein